MEDESYLQEVEKDLKSQLHKARITKVSVKAIAPSELATSSMITGGNAVEENERAKALNRVMTRYSHDAAVVLLVMPTRPTREDCAENHDSARVYLENIEILTNNLPATYLVIAGEKGNFMTTEI
tara:strand:- start:208 stop:582 length:375 start_codon:yes stop_codon:yes gene_type:complete